MRSKQCRVPNRYLPIYEPCLELKRLLSLNVKEFKIGDLVDMLLLLHFATFIMSEIYFYNIS
jgi:hypothetical protein